MIVRGGGKRVRGRIVDVIGVPDHDAVESEDGEPSTTADAEQAGTTVGKTFVLLLTRSGRFRRVDVATVGDVQPVDPQLRARFGSALDATVALSSNERGLLDIDGGGGPVRIGYLAETPVWRASYRLVVPDAGAAALQGWALIHNDTEEDWRDVALELVNGRPDSFLFPMAAPRYDRRALVVPERELSSVPQLLSTTPDAMWGDFVGDGTIALGNVGLVGHGGGSGSGAGYGSGSGVSGSRMTTSSSGLVEIGDLAALAAGHGKESRTVFAYAVAEHLDLAAGRSAMVPLVDAPMQAAMITWIDGFKTGTARHGIRVDNTTAQTLPEGTVAVYEGGGFAGEAMLPRLKPGERRFLEIGDDPDLELEIASAEQRDEPQLLAFERDALVEHLVRITSLELSWRNRSGQPRSLHVLVPAGSNTEVQGADRVDFDLDRGKPLAIFAVAPASEGKPRSVVVREGISRTVAFDGIDVAALERLPLATTLPAAARKVAAEALTRRRAQADSEAEFAALETEIATATADIERLRGHLQAMGDGGEKNPLVTRLLAGEDKLTRLRAEQDALQLELGRRKAATRAVLETLVAPGSAAN